MVGVGATAAVARYAVRNSHRITLFENMAPRSPRFDRGGFLPKMTHEEAAKILGVRQTTSKDRVIAAHRRIMMLNHPDSGGSTYIATKINEAKDLLTKEQKQDKPM